MTGRHSNRFPGPLSLFLGISVAAANLSCAARFSVEAAPDLAGEGRELALRLSAPRSEGGAGLRPAANPAEADIVLALESSWSGEARKAGDDRGPVIARFPFAPVEETGIQGISPAGLRTRTRGREGPSASDCMEGRIPLRRLKDIRPPLLALPVDGLSLDDPGYPLVLEVSVVARFYGSRGHRAQDALEKALEALRVEALNEWENQRTIVWIAAGGDMMIGRGVDSTLLAGGLGRVFDPEILRVLRGSDLALANLEGALTLRGRPEAKTYTFRSPPAVAQVLAATGMDTVLVANNHVMDWGDEGLRDTLAALAEAGMFPVGAGSDLESASGPRRLIIKGRAVAVYGAAAFPRERSGWEGAKVAAGPDRPGIHWLDGAGLERLRGAFQEDTLDIVLFHGGAEWSSVPDDRTRQLLYRLADIGADVVFGSHTHVVQGMDWREDRPVFWSLGNFVFPGMDGTPGGEDGLLVRAGFLGSRLLYLDPIPLALSSKGVRLEGGFR